MLDEQLARNMPALLDEIRKSYADRIILKELADGEVVNTTGTEFFNLVDRCVSRLIRCSLTGKHLGIMGCTRREWLANVCAVFMTGGVAVLLSPELTAEEIAERAAQTDLSAVLCDEALRETAAAARVTVLSLDSCEGEADPVRMADPAGEELACILFTSGSTAKPKAVMFSHRALVAGICHNVVSLPFEAQLAILPMHHIAGFASVFNTWYLGRVVCLGREVRYLYRYLQAMQPDYVLVVPQLLQVLVKKLRKADIWGRNLGWNLRLIGCGGAAFLPEAVSVLNERGIRVLQSYGATEAGGIGFDWEMTEESAGTLGKPCSELETKIVEGELLLRSPSLMSGYYGDPDATARVLRDGWYATGDLCTVDEAGFYHLVGRKRNVIILSNGENVSPEEIEAALMKFGVMDEVMVGLKNQQITAFIRPGRGIDAERILEAVDRYNASASRSRQILGTEFYNKPFAKTEIGKLIRAGVTGGNQS